MSPEQLVQIFRRNGVSQEETTEEADLVEREVARLRLILNPNHKNPRQTLALMLLATELVIDQTIASGNEDHIQTRFSIMGKAASLHAEIYFKKAKAR